MINFTIAANSEKSCEYNKVKLHSNYNPSREAENFVKNIQIDYTPLAIIITGPCLSYTHKYLKDRFPNSKLIAIQYSHDFTESDKIWNKTFYSCDEKENSLSESIYNYLGEDTLISTLFISWIPSQKAFISEYEYAWNNLKISLLKSRDILNTRSYFSKRWIKNSIRFCKLVKNTSYIKKGSSDIILCASGPSLKTSLNKIKTIKSKAYIICVSSALSPLVNEGIIPDLCITTDGGFWAKLHLQRPLLKHPEIAVALPAEGCANASTFLNNKIIALDYFDGPSKDLLNKTNVKSMEAKRNGTVSGTAALFALSLTSGNVYFCGLDLCESKNFTHTQPNQLEIRDSLFDNKIKTKETRLFPQSLKNQSLEIYKNWFSTQNFNNRLFRLSDNYKFQNSFNNIKDVNWDYFNSNYNKNNCDFPKIIPNEQSTNCNIKSEILNIVQENLNSTKWDIDAFPIETLMKNRYKKTEKHIDYKNKLTEKKSQLKEELTRYILK